MSHSSEWMIQIEEVAQKASEQVGCYLYDIEFVGSGQGRTLRVYIDKAENPSLDDCSNISKSINEFLDANENLIPGGSYYLEVSTPGIERPLKAKWHYEKVIGKKIWIKIQKPLEALGVQDKKIKNSKTLEEVLSSCDEQGVSFLVNGNEVKIPYDVIEKAKLIFEMVKGQKK